ncbi:MAG: hypothetical protein ABI831_09940 [Betaproteobacteria bacterium]
MNRLLLLLLSIVLAVSAFAAEPRRYAAMSLIGDQMELVVARMQTGSNVPANAREVVPFPDPALDRFILRTIDRIVAAETRGEGVTMLAARDPRLYALQESLLSQDASVENLLAAVKTVVSNQKATHLILVTRYRHEALLRSDDGIVGSGRLSGIGFYVDHVRPMRRDRLEQSIGFLAPYTYFQVLIVDLDTLRIVRSETAMGSRVHVPPVSGSVVHPWETMDDAGKVEALQSLLREELERVLPPLLKVG